MPKKQFVYIKPEKGSTLRDQLNECFASIKKTLEPNGVPFKYILKQTVFLNAADNDDFYAKKKQIIDAFKDFYKSDFPPTAVVGQPPEEKNLFTFELILLENGEKEIEVARKDLGDNRYTVVRGPRFKLVYAAGLTAGEAITGTLNQSKDAFEQMKKILENENMDFSHVVRQWNYIENITGSTHLEDGEKQNYQVFNDVRGLYYESSDFTHGYPAATGIGMNYGGVVLEFIAADAPGVMDILPIDNPLQVDAHHYSDEVLVGKAIEDIPVKAPPKFERAKLLVNKETGACLIYISGTAAIRGQETMAENDVEKQTRVTIENIANLVSPGNLKRYGVLIGQEILPFAYFRVYVKNEADLSRVKQICTPFFKDAPGEYLISDICRESLLVEIEGVAGY